MRTSLRTFAAALLLLPAEVWRGNEKSHDYDFFSDTEIAKVTDDQMKLTTLTLTALLFGGGDAGVRVMHEVHSTHTRAVVENGSVMWKVRLFSDDLEKGLRAYARRPAFALDRDPKADSLFTAYFNAKVSVSADGRALKATLVQQGVDKDPVGGTVHWYLLQFNAARAPGTLSIRNTLLTELFPNQANIVVLLSMPGEKRHSLYFGDGDNAAQTVELRR